MPITIFDGLAPEGLEQILAGRQKHVFQPGEIVIHEGERVGQLFVIEAGTAEIYLIDVHGGEHVLNRVGPGSALGEMALATGQPASADVRALTTLETVALTPEQFREAADRYPQIHWNVTAILADRLARADHRTLEATKDKVTVLKDYGAPPLVGYALACSAAWHARLPVLQLVLGAGEPPEEIRGLATLLDESGESALLALAASARAGSGPRAHLVFAPFRGMFAHDRLEQTAQELSRSFAHVFLQMYGQTPNLEFRSVDLVGGPESPNPAGDSRFRIRGWVDQLASAVRPRDGLIGVPQLSHTDEEALTRGVLPLQGPVGSVLGHVARDVTGTTVGLALGAGSWKGYAHVGVLRALERLGVPIDYAAGSSIGAVVAASIAAGYGWEQCAAILDAGGSVAFLPTIPVGGLLSHRRLYSVIRRLASEEGRIEDMRIPLAIVAADIETHAEVVFREGLMAPALMASMSLPGVYPAMRIGPHTLVDGGVINPVPTSVIAGMGAHKIISVRLSLRGPSQQTFAKGAYASGRPPTALRTILRSIDMMQSRMSIDTASRATITLAPDFTGIPDPGIRGFVRGRGALERGEAAVEQALMELRAALPWLGRAESHDQAG